MPSLELELEVWCSCGNGLCGQSRAIQTRGCPGVEVEPCEKCTDAAYQAGYDEGYSAGYDAGGADAEKELGHIS